MTIVFIQTITPTWWWLVGVGIAVALSIIDNNKEKN